MSEPNGDAPKRGTADDVSDVFSLMAARQLTMADLVRGGMLAAVYTAAENERRSRPNGAEAPEYDATSRNMPANAFDEDVVVQVVKAYKGPKKRAADEDDEQSGLQSPISKPSDAYREALTSEVTRVKARRLKLDGKPSEEEVIEAQCGVRVVDFLK